MSAPGLCGLRTEIASLNIFGARFIPSSFGAASRASILFKIGAIATSVERNLHIGKGDIGLGNKYLRRSGNVLNTISLCSTRCHGVSVLGGVKFGTVHAARGPPSTTLVRIYSHLKVCICSRTFST